MAARGGGPCSPKVPFNMEAMSGHCGAEMLSSPSMSSSAVACLIDPFIVAMQQRSCFGVTAGGALDMRGQREDDSIAHHCFLTRLATSQFAKHLR